jgi:hypothetical protein
MALVDFLMTLQSTAEVREYIQQYLGTAPAVAQFAEGFIARKGFEQQQPARRK